MSFIRWGLLVFCFVFVACQSVDNESLNLKNQTWSLVSANDSIRLDSVNPSDVHLALMAKEIVPDPYFRDNEYKVQWVGESDWCFQTTFDVPGSLLKQEEINLVFKGLDTYAQVWLNDQLLIKTDNMFRQWVVTVKEWLVNERNQLKVCFTSPIAINQDKQRLYGIPLPEVRAFTRKAPYQFGWDWGPRLVTMGIWKPAYLEGWSHARMADVFVKQQDVTDSIAHLTILTTIESTENNQAVLKLSINGKPMKTVDVDLHPGNNTCEIPVTLFDPQLWYPNGMGEAQLTAFQVDLHLEENIQTTTVLSGIRKIELIQERDSLGAGFGFRVNDRDLYIKGANYIPQDNFPSRVTLAQTRDLLLMAQESNINMLRVWGGGVYESDDFYSLCDSLGILIWQDFMFAGTVYPGDEEFVQNVSQEAKEQVIRLRNHPCIALWCGNNEVDEAWHNWGWQKSLGYSRADSTRLWNDYLYLFEGILPETVNEFAPATVYVPSSPANGWGRDKAYRQGDVHYWGVWWGNEPFETYNEKVGRFVSEYGFQGMPDMRTIESFTLPEDRNLGSEVMAVHQKHPRGKELIRDYMERDYLIPSKLEDYIYVSQLLQARGIKTAIEAHRRAKPYNIGTLYWQFNDCWPVTSWSGIDVDHRWKALQYSVRKAYDRFLISFTQEKDSLSIWMVGDCYVDRTPQLTWQLITFDGDTLAAGKNTFAFPMGSSVVALKLDLRSLLIPLSVKNKVVLKASVRDQNESLVDALHYFCRPKELLLSPDPGLSLSAIPDTLKYQITLTTRKLAKNIWLQSSTDGWFSNNYFDLLPGETQTISFTPHKASKSLPIFTVTSLGQIN